MTTGLVWHERYAWHDLGSGAGPFLAGGWIEPGEQHAEHAATKRRIYNLLNVAGMLDVIVAVPPREATEQELLRFHRPEYVSRVRELSGAGGGALGLDSFVPAGSFEIAALAAGGALCAVDEVLTGRLDDCYALLRPPGHHAEADNGAGFCIFNNVVLAAEHALAAHGLERVAIVDWDVHHGNGAQRAFYDDPRVLTISIHQDGVFPPASGAPEEIGGPRARGLNLNVALPPGSGWGAYSYALERVALPALERFGPELVLVACGFDANGFDPMSRQLLHSEAFALMTRAVKDAARRLCDGRLVLTHEGGYHIGTVPFCGLAVLEALTDHRTEVVDPFLEPLRAMPGQALADHQRDAVERTVQAAEISSE